MIGNMKRQSQNGRIFLEVEYFKGTCIQNIWITLTTYYKRYIIPLKYGESFIKNFIKNRNKMLENDFNNTYAKICKRSNTGKDPQYN